jgi:hypothetical protein
MKTLPNGQYLSVKEFAVKSGMSRQAIYNALKSERLKGYNIDGVWIIPSDALITGCRNRDGSTIGITDLKNGNMEAFLQKRGFRIK